MKRLSIFLLILLLGGMPNDVKAGEAAIAGRIIITKVLTKKRVVMPTYDLRGAAVTPPSPSNPAKESDFSANELSRVVVYLEGRGLTPGKPTKVSLAQKDRQFEPEFVVVPVGSTVAFPNADPIFHNVFSLSKVKQFDLGYYPSGESRSVKFEQSGIVQVFCHIHADMSATILVLPNEFWARPDAEGKFSLTGVPPGTYKLIAWHRSAGLFTRSVTVKGQETQNVEFVIPVREPDSGRGAGRQ